MTAPKIPTGRRPSDRSPEAIRLTKAICDTLRKALVKDPPRSK